ncbi:MAG: nickel pincer cofactor biosynthesis protein LarB [Litoreibacter sp.]
MSEVKLDHHRRARIGVGEAILCAGKSPAQLVTILESAAEKGSVFLLTRLEPDMYRSLPGPLRDRLDYHPASRTGFLGQETAPTATGEVAIITAGSVDAPVAREAERTLIFNGHAPEMIFDVGVAGIWRLMERVDGLAEKDVVIAVAGMDAALPSVLGGLIGAPLIAVPTSSGYGATRGGETALAACLVSCAPGLMTVNIDNGYGAAIAALRILNIRG